ncbi:hypothetical protein BD779DRAFT_1238211 [Infundibulicybe gibba]|nr:hypothetical protein BD779DRAFT_1238211 [Infundibulicybe gibba]
MVWRCWVVWYSVGHRAAYGIAFFPALMLAASLGIFVPCSLMTHPTSPLQGSHYRVGRFMVHADAGHECARHRAYSRAADCAPSGDAGDPYSARRGARVLNFHACRVRHVLLHHRSGVHDRDGLAQPPQRAIPRRSNIHTGYLIIARLAYGRGWQTNTISVPSKVVFLGHVSAKDAQAGNEEEVLDTLKASGTAE